jgi:hypothetical protein
MARRKAMQFLCRLPLQLKTDKARQLTGPATKALAEPLAHVDGAARPTASPGPSPTPRRHVIGRDHFHGQIGRAWKAA